MIYGKVLCHYAGRGILAKRYNLYVDGQNVPVGFIPKIMEYCSATGAEQEQARLYGSTTDIARIVGKSGTLLADYDIDTVSVQCRPRKNSVDIKMAVDIIEDALRHPDCALMVIATNDSDFTHVASRVISYRRSELHLLHTGEAPSGYSDRVRMTRLKAPSKREKSAGKVMVAAIPAPAKVKETPAPAPRPGFVPDPDYSHRTPIVGLTPAGFAMRIMATSPIAIDSRCLFHAWKDFTGQAWKGRNSKKSAQQFFDEQFPVGSYRFFEWKENTVNSGYFLHRDYASIEVARGYNNAAFSVLGAEESLLDRQCDLIANAIRNGPYENYNFLYDSSAEANVLPRYGAWGIVEAWSKNRSGADAPPRWVDPLPRDAAVEGRALRTCFESEVRRQFETGELALLPRDDTEAVEPDPPGKAGPGDVPIAFAARPGDFLASTGQAGG